MDHVLLVELEVHVLQAVQVGHVLVEPVVLLDLVEVVARVLAVLVVLLDLEEVEVLVLVVLVGLLVLGQEERVGLG